MIFFSIAEGEHAWMFWRWPTALRWNRIFSIVRLNDETPDIQTPSSSGEASQQPDAAANPWQRRKSAARSAPRPLLAAIEARIGHKFADSSLLPRPSRMFPR